MKIDLDDVLVFLIGFITAAGLAFFTYQLSYFDKPRPPAYQGEGTPEGLKLFLAQQARIAHQLCLADLQEPSFIPKRLRKCPPPAPAEGRAAHPE